MVDSGLAKLGYDYINIGSLDICYLVLSLFSLVHFSVEKEI
jgi:hypothetical protein